MESLKNYGIHPSPLKNTINSKLNAFHFVNLREAINFFNRFYLDCKDANFVVASVKTGQCYVRLRPFVSLADHDDTDGVGIFFNTGWFF